MSYIYNELSKSDKMKAIEWLINSISENPAGILILERELKKLEQ
jgi:hypothetical protein